MQDCVAHAIADLGARHCLSVCPMQGRPCHGVGGRRTVGPPLLRAAVTGGVQELKCPDSENHLRDEQVTTRFPLPSEHEGESPIIFPIMRRSLKEGLEFGKAKWECSLASILHWEASLFSCVIMVVVLALEV